MVTSTRYCMDARNGVHYWALYCMHCGHAAVMGTAWVRLAFWLHVVYFEKPLPFMNAIDLMERNLIFFASPHGACDKVVGAYSSLKSIECAPWECRVSVTCDRVSEDPPQQPALQATFAAFRARIWCICTMAWTHTDWTLQAGHS